MNNKSTRNLLIITFFGVIALNMAHPVTPLLIRTLGLPSFIFGVFFATMSIGNFIFSPIWGKISDSNGRIKFMILGLVGYGISQLGFGLSSNTFTIIIFRFLGGAFVTSYLTVSIAYLTDITTKENRLKIMGYYSAVNTVGGALGALLGGVIGNINYKQTFIWQFIISMAISFCIYIFLEETLIKKKNKFSIKELIPKLEFREKSVNKEILLVMVIVVIFYFSATSYNSTINFYIESVLEMPPTFNGLFLSVAGIIGFLANVIITPILGNGLDEKITYKTITLLLCISIGAASLVNNKVLFFIFIIIFVALSSIYIPIQQNMLTKLSNGNYGALMGMQNSAKAVGMVLGSLTAGFIFDFGNKLPFFIGSVVLLVGYLVLSKIKIN